MDVAISGSHGLVGSALIERLEGAGHTVHRMVRGAADGSNAPTDIAYDPTSGTIDPAAFDEIDAVVNLAGVSIAGGLWTEKRKRAIRDSRIDVTRLIAHALCDAAPRPRTLVSTSAVGYYGDRGDQVLTEESAPGSGFLADVCQAWEATSREAETCGVRVVNPRFGVVLSGKGGMLPLIAKPFKLALGGPIGSDEQYFAWIALDDLVEILILALEQEEVRGPVNAVTPETTTNRMFTKAIGKAVHRPTVIPLPKAVLTTVAGDLARDLLLPSQRVEPVVLESQGFTFQYPTVDAAVGHALG